MTLRVGTRGSKLARIQAQIVVDILREAGLASEVVVVSTKGDRFPSLPIHKIGKNGIFVGELERALEEGTVDIAVHSLKDMPSSIPTSLTLAPPPAAPLDMDVFVGEANFKEADLSHMTVATGSTRRLAQLKHFYPTVKTVPIRGNVETRIRKVEEGLADGTLLAYAGLYRAGLAHKMTAPLDPTRFIPSPAQGLLGIELVKDRKDLLKIFQDASDPYAAFRMEVERAYQKALNAGCESPVGIHIERRNGSIILHGCYAETVEDPLVYASVKTTEKKAALDALNLARKVQYHE
ncbi:MAG: hydroxymethylbilane synthase [Peptoniphilus sp.]|nr:hydroxymethylbilane synthase [Peptoniphilus sp.]MDY3118000.1 hydroxymethylbilane synthase [Peptoniphilus sp.]